MIWNHVSPWDFSRDNSGWSEEDRDNELIIEANLVDPDICMALKNNYSINSSDTDHGSQISSRTTTIRTTRSPWTTSQTRFRVTAHMMRTLLSISKIVKLVDTIDTRTLPDGHISSNVVSSGGEYVITQQELLVTTFVPRLDSLNPTPNPVLTTTLSQETGERMYSWRNLIQRNAIFWRT